MKIFFNLLLALVGSIMIFYFCEVVYGYVLMAGSGAVLGVFSDIKDTDLFMSMVAFASFFLSVVTTSVIGGLFVINSFK